MTESIVPSSKPYGEPSDTRQPIVSARHSSGMAVTSLRIHVSTGDVMSRVYRYGRRPGGPSALRRALRMSSRMTCSKRASEPCSRRTSFRTIGRSASTVTRASAREKALSRSSDVTCHRTFCSNAAETNMDGIIIPIVQLTAVPNTEPNERSSTLKKASDKRPSSTQHTAVIAKMSDSLAKDGGHHSGITSRLSAWCDEVKVASSKRHQSRER
mmetsp:Transcript_160/g.401  ORF Transcript_160/g.401 Transcript_160/m.401 type:complete len:213 (-) Transcript_160:274-912(-)